MRILGLVGAVILMCETAAICQQPDTQSKNEGTDAQAAHQLLDLANGARVSAGLAKLEWDAGLANAAMKHCLRMSTEGQIAHRYPGEDDLTTRVGASGAHFRIIEENIAVASRVTLIHQGWLDSTEHRANLLNPRVDRVGIAVVTAQGVHFAVADYAEGVPELTQTEVEAVFAKLLRARGLMISNETGEARAYCAGPDVFFHDEIPQSMTRWQDPEVSRLPEELVRQLATSRYRKAAVGSCPPRDVNGAFTTYRVAVLLY